MDFPFPTENVMLWFFSVKKHLEAHRGLGFGHTFCFSKWLKICLKMSHSFIHENETLLKDFPPLCAYLLIATMAEQRNRTKRFFWSLKTEALPESLSCGIWGFCQSFSIWLCASFCQSGSRHASWFFQRIFSYHFLQRKKPSLPPGFKHIVNLTGNSTQVWPAIKSFKNSLLAFAFFFERSWHFKVEKTKRENGETTKISSVLLLHDWNWRLWEKNDTRKIPSEFSSSQELLTTLTHLHFFFVVYQMGESRKSPSTFFPPFCFIKHCISCCLFYLGFYERLQYLQKGVSLLFL